MEMEEEREREGDKERDGKGKKKTSAINANYLWGFLKCIQCRNKRRHRPGWRRVCTAVQFVSAAACPNRWWRRTSAALCRRLMQDNAQIDTESFFKSTTIAASNWLVPLLFPLLFTLCSRSVGSHLNASRISTLFHIYTQLHLYKSARQF